MTETEDEFLADLRRLVKRWQADVPKLEAVGEHRLADQVRAWVAEAEGIIAAHEPVRAERQEARKPHPYGEAHETDSNS